MDALSDLLHTVKLNGALFLEARRAFKREFDMPPAAWRRQRAGARAS